MKMIQKRAYFTPAEDKVIKHAAIDYGVGIKEFMHLAVLGFIFAKKIDSGEWKYPDIVNHFYEKQEYRCALCKETHNKNDMQLDHKHPKSKGGQDSYFNFQLLCKSCNQKKGAKIDY